MPADERRLASKSEMHRSSDAVKRKPEAVGQLAAAQRFADLSMPRKLLRLIHWTIIAVFAWVSYFTLIFGFGIVTGGF